MDRTCEDCGKPLKGRSNKRFCDSTCRSRASVKGASSAPTPSSGVGEVEASTRARVDVSSPLGAVAVVLARRVDRAGLTEPGSSVAALTRELRAVLAEVGAPPAGDRVDELQAKREARLRERAG